MDYYVFKPKNDFMPIPPSTHALFVATYLNFHTFLKQHNRMDNLDPPSCHKRPCVLVSTFRQFVYRGSVIYCVIILWFLRQFQIINYTHVLSRNPLLRRNDLVEPIRLVQVSATTKQGLDPFGQDLRTYLALINDARAVFQVRRDYDYAASPLSTTTQPPLTIAQYSNVYGPSETWSDVDKHFDLCALPCAALGEYHSVAAAAEADVVIINVQDFSMASIPWARPPQQLWVGVYFESAGHYPAQGSQAALQHFNYTMGYRPDADLPVFSMVHDTFKHYAEVRTFALPGWEAKQHPEIPHMSVWISNCQTETTARMRILSELVSENITVASYGRCQRTHLIELEALAGDRQWQAWGRQGDGEALTAMATQHLFFYAAENSACAYYVTEKVFHGLLAGSVPIYVGDAVRLKMIAPPNSVIYLEDFANTHELSRYLHSLIDDRDLYERHLAWRQDPASVAQLQRIMAPTKWALEFPERQSCALCEFLHRRPRQIRAEDLCTA